MASKSSIEWTDATWTPIRARVRADAAAIAASKGYTSLVQIAERMAGHVGPHCEHASRGCDNCYSETANARCLPHNGTGLPFDRRSRDLVDAIIDEKILEQPLRWREPREIFVCSQTDLFGEWVPDELIDRVIWTMANCPEHTFQVLTKRAERMAAYMNSRFDLCGDAAPWPLPNVHLGVSVEDQAAADARIPHLLRTPAAVRFVSAEPLLGQVDLRKYLPRRLGLSEIPGSALNDGATEMQQRGIGWVIIGGESGPDARPCDIAHVRDLLRQCREAGVPAFVKQLGALVFTPLFYLKLRDKKGGVMAEWPADLRVREKPEAR